MLNYLLNESPRTGLLSTRVRELLTGNRGGERLTRCSFRIFTPTLITNKACWLILGFVTGNAPNRLGCPLSICLIRTMCPWNLISRNVCCGCRNCAIQCHTGNRKSTLMHPICVRTKENDRSWDDCYSWSADPSIRKQALSHCTVPSCGQP